MPVKTRKITDSYFEMINEFPLRKIRNTDEHRQALAVFSRFAGRDRIDRGIVDYLGVLAGLIAEYEKSAGYTIDVSGLRAADVVRHLMDENQLTISGLARELGIVQSNLSEMLSGKREWSKKAIKGLAGRFGLNPLLFFS